MRRPLTTTAAASSSSASSSSSTPSSFSQQQQQPLSSIVTSLSSSSSSAAAAVTSSSSTVQTQSSHFHLDRDGNQKLRKRRTGWFSPRLYLPPLLLLILLFGNDIWRYATQSATDNNDKRPLSSSSSSSTTTTTTSTTASTSTVVTAYFPIRSKYGKESYMEWMKTMLSLTDAMVVFTTPDMVPLLRPLRTHAPTEFVVMSLEEVPLAQEYSVESTWQPMLDRDPERKRHAGYRVFWIWLSKTYFVTEAIRRNPFRSTVFVWSDIGCFRGKQVMKRYGHQPLVAHPEIVPPTSILFLSHKDQPQPPPSLWWTNKLRQKEYFYHSGTQAAGRATVWVDFHAKFLLVLQGFLDRQLFAGDDQTVLQCTCLQYPHLCAYITRNQVKDNHYFGLRYALHYGGNYHYWRPPAIQQQQQQQPNDST